MQPKKNNTDGNNTEKIEDNPFIAMTPQPNNTKVVSNSNAIDSKANSPLKPSLNHDPATLMLIESEFRDATHQERQEWFALLKDVPPERIPQILSVRRLTLKKQKSMPTKETFTDLAVAQNSPGSLLEYVQSEETNPLGSTSPWGDLAEATTQKTVNKHIPLDDSQGAVLTGIDDAPMTKTIPTQNMTLNADLPPHPGVQSNLDNKKTKAKLKLSSSDLPGQGFPVSTKTNIRQKSVDGQLVSLKKMNTEKTNTASTNQTDAWKTELQKLIALSEAEIAQANPTATDEEKLKYVSKQVHLRMLYLMGNQQGRALQAIEKLPPAEQEFWQQTFWGIANYFDAEAIPDASDRASQTINQLSSAIASLQETAKLELKNVHFCSKIDSYGSYNKFERDEFKPGQPVLIYGELKNFLSEPSQEGKFRTVIKSTVTIYKAGPQGGLIAENKFPPTEDLCRNKRNDYFHSYMINIPERIALGPHVLKLTVEDQLSQKISTYTLKFTVK